MNKIIMICSSILFLASCNNANESNTSTDTSTMKHDDNDMKTRDEAAMTRDNNTVSDADRDFIMKVAMGNTAEVEAGNLATKKGASFEVRDFGSAMVKDHGEAQDKLKVIAKQLDVNAPDSADQEHKDMRQQLNGLSGKTFDMQYIDGQLKDHRATIDLFEKQISNGANAQLKAFATSTLPHLKMHLENAEKIKSAQK